VNRIAFLVSNVIYLAYVEYKRGSTTFFAALFAHKQGGDRDKAEEALENIEFDMISTSLWHALQRVIRIHKKASGGVSYSCLMDGASATSVDFGSETTS
jgi:hypothetical protein